MALQWHSGCDVCRWHYCIWHYSSTAVMCVDGMTMALQWHDGCDVCTGGVWLRARGDKPGWTDCQRGVVQGNAGHHAGWTIQDTRPAFLRCQPIIQDIYIYNLSSFAI